MSAPVLNLTVAPQQTSLDCAWTVSGSSFSSISSAVLTYTDVSGNYWRTKNVSYEGRSVSRESIVDLASDTQYAVFLTLRGVLDGESTTTTLVSSTVIARTGKIPDKPLISLLSGANYIQVLFTATENTHASGHSVDIGDDPYDFALNEVKNVVVSYNKIRTTNGTHVSATGAQDFNVTTGDIKTHTFTDVSGNTMTYNYILLTDLETEEGFQYEVAAVYYNDYGPGELSETKKIGLNATGGRDDTASDQNKAFISYALNDAGAAVDTLYPLGATPIKINVNWLNPYLVTGDTLADLEMMPKEIQRFKQDGGQGISDGNVVPLVLDVNYTKVGSIYTYVDTSSLSAGETYSYKITVQTLDGTATKESVTNLVVALTTTTVALVPANLVLDSLDGSIKLDAAFTDIVTDTGGFSVTEFDNAHFKLVYKFVGELEGEKEILIDDDRVSCDPITRTDGQKQLEYARIESKPVHDTVYIDSWSDPKTQSLYYINDTSELSLLGNYNTTFPHDVTDFSYTNATVAGTTADEDFTLTWDDNDTTNDDSVQYYRVIAEKSDASSLTIVLSKTDVQENVTADKYVTITRGSVTFNSGTDAFFETGNDYKFSIQRGYVHLNTITTKSYPDLVVDAGVPSNELLYGAINSKEVDLIMFSNPPQPVISVFEFDENTGVLNFKLEYDAATDAVSNYGFLKANTNFRVQVEVDGSIDNRLTTYNVQPGNSVTVDMSTVAVGASCKLIVQEYVNTTYNSESNDIGSFYSTVSTASTKDFVREGLLAAPTSVTSYNSNGAGVALDGSMNITWTAVAAEADAAAAALDVNVFYRMVVTDASNNNSTSTLYLVADLGVETLPAGGSEAIYTPGTSNSYTITGLTVGHYYSYEITSMYYDANFLKHVYSDPTSTTESIISFLNPPAPVISLFTFNEETGVLGFKLEYDAATDAVSNYGFLKANTNFRVQVEVDGTPLQTVEDIYEPTRDGELKVAVNMSNVSVGRACTLKVQEYVDTNYTSDPESDKFYSAYSDDSTKTFVRQGPLAAPTGVISYNSNGAGVALDGSMNITWDPKSDAAATALTVPVYYEIVVTNGTNSNISPGLFLLGADDTNFDKLFHADADMDNSNVALTTAKRPYYTLDPLPFFVDSSGASVTYGTANSKRTVTLPGHTIGSSYSYKIRSVYYDARFTKYVYSDYVDTARSLISFKRPPQPVIKIDVETATDKLGVTTAYGRNDNLQVCGFANTDITFEYIWNGADINDDLDTGYNEIASNGLITLGNNIPISFYTYLNTIASSDVNTLSKFRSLVVDNTQSTNAAVYTSKPQIKWVNVEYIDLSCNIIVNVEPNGGTISEVVLIANTYNMGNVLTSQTIHEYVAEASVDPLANLSTSHPTEKDHLYSYNLSNVILNGLDSITIVVHTSTGLNVITLPDQGKSNVLDPDPIGAFVENGRHDIQLALVPN